MMKLLIVVPCYNEEEVLADTHRQLSGVLSELRDEGLADEGGLLFLDVADF